MWTVWTQSRSILAVSFMLTAKKTKQNVLSTVSIECYKPNPKQTRTVIHLASSLITKISTLLTTVTTVLWLTACWRAWRSQGTHLDSLHNQLGIQLNLVCSRIYNGCTAHQSVLTPEQKLLQHWHFPEHCYENQQNPHITSSKVWILLLTQCNLKQNIFFFKQAMVNAILLKPEYLTLSLPRSKS